MITARQQAWLDAAEHSSEPVSTFFGLLALPNENEREHNCSSHAIGFSRNSRRGFKCGICRKVIKWIDEETQ